MYYEEGHVDRRRKPERGVVFDFRNSGLRFHERRFCSRLHNWHGSKDRRSCWACVASDLARHEKEGLMAVVYCRKCGAEMPEDAKFCPKCGAGVEQKINQAWGFVALFLLVLGLTTLFGFVGTIIGLLIAIIVIKVVSK